jgi:hypothetical protein
MWMHVHLVVEYLRLASLGLRNEELIEHVEDILADSLELILDLLAVLSDSADVLIRSLGLFLLLDGRDDAPRGTARADDVLVGHRQQISLIDAELTTDLQVLVGERNSCFVKCTLATS